MFQKNCNTKMFLQLALVAYFKKTHFLEIAQVFWYSYFKKAVVLEIQGLVCEKPVHISL